jgi:hypothetical protein
MPEEERCSRLIPDRRGIAVDHRTIQAPQPPTNAA